MPSRGEHAHRLRFPRYASYHDATQQAPAFGLPGDPAAVEAMVMERAMVRQHSRRRSPKMLAFESASPNPTPLNVNTALLSGRRPTSYDTVGMIQYVAQLEYQLAALETEHSRLCRVMLRHVSRNAAAELELEEAEVRQDLMKSFIAYQQRLTSALHVEFAALAAGSSSKASLAALIPKDVLAGGGSSNGGGLTSATLRDIENAQRTLHAEFQETRHETFVALNRAATAAESCTHAAGEIHREIDRFLRTTAEEHQTTRAAVARSTSATVDAVQGSETSLSLRFQAAVNTSAATTENSIANVANNVGAMHNDLRQNHREIQRHIVESSEHAAEMIAALSRQVEGLLRSSFAATTVVAPSPGVTSPRQPLVFMSSAERAHLNTLVKMYTEEVADRSLCAASAILSRVVATYPSAAPTPARTASSSRRAVAVQVDPPSTSNVASATLSLSTAAKGVQSVADAACAAAQTEEELEPRHRPPIALPALAPTMPPSPAASSSASAPGFMHGKTLSMSSESSRTPPPVASLEGPQLWTVTPVSPQPQKKNDPTRPETSTMTPRIRTPPPARHAMSSWDTEESTSDVELSLDSTDDNRPAPNGPPPAAAATEANPPPTTKVEKSAAVLPLHDVPLISIARRASASSGDPSPSPQSDALGTFTLPLSGEYFNFSQSDLPPVHGPAAAEESSPSGRLRKASSFDSPRSHSGRSPRSRTVIFLGDDGPEFPPSLKTSLTNYPNGLTVPPVATLGSPQRSLLGQQSPPKPAPSAAAPSSPSRQGPQEVHPSLVKKALPALGGGAPKTASSAASFISNSVSSDKRAVTGDFDE